MRDQPTNNQQRNAERLQAFVSRNDLSIVITDNTTSFQNVMQLVRDHLKRVSSVDHNTVLEIITALDEALSNAVIHGNLELSSANRLDPNTFRRLVQERREQPPYCERRVSLEVRVLPQSIELLLSDDGHGFDPSTVPEPRESARPSPSGHGLLLMRTFMDEVRFNKKGNTITMIRRLPKVAGA
jgi:anti-sigma regulatory factor (Ser/Thr protein kinase)